MRSLLLVAALGCSSKTTPPMPQPDLDLGGLGGRHEAVPRPTPDTPDAAPVIAKMQPAPSAAAATGVDFIADAKLLYRIAACGGSDDGRSIGLDGDGDPKALDKIIKQHCKYIQSNIAKFRAAYFDKHRAWFEDVVPKDIPRTVVYPFGGGDLLSALVAFPDATEVTTISLELAGDPRRIRTITPDQLAASLGALRVEIGGLIQVGSNTSANLSSGQRNELPGQVSSFLIGLVAAGYEPVAMHYFTLDDTGAIRYLDQAAIDALEPKRNKALKGDWASPNFSEAFSHVEIQYKKPGESITRVHRHFGWNLGDEYLAKHPQLLAHLAAKGKVTLLTKGASYLLQRSSFSQIRTYMLDHLAWMLSDSTGIAPTYAEPAGMVQETYGSYSGAFLEGGQGNRHDQSFIELWRKQPRRKLGFRFGYVDLAGAAHLVVTRPKG